MRRKNKLLICLIISCLSSLAFNLRAEKSEDITILHFGIYAHTPDNGKTWINPISDKTINSTSLSPVHLKHTRTIPAKTPLFFGFEYQIVGIEDKLIKITSEVSHPQIRQQDGSISSHYNETNSFLVIDKKVTAINGYLLETEDELKAGDWVFHLKKDGKTIATQNFTVK
ncbi:MAG: DUF3859 domain-containing protein [Gammaproteobacteria bacterium]|nr:DUF3859 domain-containing protein [Gammaproteobacteria bacterium]